MVLYLRHLFPIVLATGIVSPNSCSNPGGIHLAFLHLGCALISLRFLG
jgi:hypothetical protein